MHVPCGAILNVIDKEVAVLGSKRVWLVVVLALGLLGCPDQNEGTPTPSFSPSPSTDATPTFGLDTNPTPPGETPTSVPEIPTPTPIPGQTPTPFPPQSTPATPTPAPPEETPTPAPSGWTPTPIPPTPPEPTPVRDLDGDGFVAVAYGGDDCDDQDPTVNPDAREVCDSVHQKDTPTPGPGTPPAATPFPIQGIDEDCDGLVDDEDPDVDPATQSRWFPDTDQDGWGDAASEGSLFCADPSTMDQAWSTEALDCNDQDPGIHVGALEVCNGADDDCDGAVDDADEDVVGGSSWYADQDGDGYGNVEDVVVACVAPAGYVSDGTDCDDTSSSVNPGALEVCNGADDDCDGAVDATGGLAACYTPTNIDPGLFWAGEAELRLALHTVIHTDTGEIEGIRQPGEGLVDGIYFEVVSQSNGTFLGVFSATGIEVVSGVTVQVVGPYPLVLVSATDIVVGGTLMLAGGNGMDAYTTQGPNAAGAGRAGGADGGKGSDNHYAGATAGSGPGAGGLGVAGVHYGNGGGGGGHCYGGGGGMGDRPSVAGSPGTASSGGAGGFNYGDGGRGGDGGDPYDDLSLSPLQGGSGGAGGLSDTDYNPNGAGGGGGAGGGAVQISAAGAILISGEINASGGRGGDAYGGGGGGGSGGAILLEAESVTVTGLLKVDGGRGGNGNLFWVPSGQTGGAAGSGTSPGGGGGGIESGGGGGAAGYVVIRYRDTVDVSGQVSPDLSTACATAVPML